MPEGIVKVHVYQQHSMQGDSSLVFGVTRCECNVSYFGVAQAAVGIVHAREVLSVFCPTDECRHQYTNIPIIPLPSMHIYNGESCVLFKSRVVSFGGVSVVLASSRLLLTCDHIGVTIHNHRAIRFLTFTNSVHCLFDGQLQ